MNIDVDAHDIPPKSLKMALKSGDIPCSGFVEIEDLKDAK
jgi:hypothetical protein